MVRSRVGPIDVLYLDMNGIIHVESRKVLERLGIASEHELVEVMCKAIGDYVEKILSFVRPRDIVYLAIDGPAPLAKMVQQRSRRYRSVHINEHIRNLRESFGLPAEKSWDSNQITPGTEFLALVGERLKRYLRVGQRPYTVILSDGQVPGEGEHKAAAHLREYSPCHPRARVAIYGLDADLIMLGLASHHKNVFLLRESEEVAWWEKAGTFRYIDLGVIRKGILDRIRDAGVHVKDRMRTIDDFVCFSFLLGNDFVPSLPSLRIRENGVKLLIEAYAMARQTSGQSHLVHTDLSLNLQVLRKMLAYLAKSAHIRLNRFRELDAKPSESFHKNQERIMQRQRRNMDRGKMSKPEGPMTATSVAFDEALYNFRNLIPRPRDTIRLGTTDYEARYYQAYFGGIKVHDICAQYLNIMRWSVAYYRRGCPDWRYCFDHEHAPLSADLVTALDAVSALPPFPVSPPKPLLPFEQLMVVLPPQSRQFVPDKYAQLMNEPDLYPPRIELDKVNKRFLWQCPPYLPTIHLDKLLVRLRSLGSPGQPERNTLHRDEIIVRSRYQKRGRKKEPGPPLVEGW